jgi:hypothetical protein
MAIIKSKEIELIWKLNPSTFEKVNSEVYGNPHQRLGSKQSSVARMTNTYGEEMKMLLPTIIRTSPQDIDWHKKVAYYWDSVSYQIPSSGKKLEIGFSYDLNDGERKEAITSLCSKVKEIKTDEDLANYCEDLNKVKEEDKFRYGKPINLNDYLMYRYCLVDGDVANSIDVANKSTRIRFIISDPKQLQDFKRKHHAIKVKATHLYTEALSDESKVDNILYAMGVDITNMDKVDRELKLEELSSDADEFIKIVTDKNLIVRAKIERYILGNVLNRLPDSSIIVDATDVTCTIGGDINEAINFFTSEDPIKVAKQKEFAAKMKNNLKTQ